MRLCALLCVVLTAGFHKQALDGPNTARRRTARRATAETKSPYEVMGVRSSSPDAPDVSKATWEKAKSPDPRMRVPASRLHESRRRSSLAARAAACAPLCVFCFYLRVTTLVLQPASRGLAVGCLVWVLRVSGA